MHVSFNYIDLCTICTKKTTTHTHRPIVQLNINHFSESIDQSAPQFGYNFAIVHTATTHSTEW